MGQEREEEEKKVSDPFIQKAIELGNELLRAHGEYRQFMVSVTDPPLPEGKVLRVTAEIVDMPKGRHKFITFGGITRYI